MVVFGERGEEEGGGNHSVGRKGIKQQGNKKKAFPKSTVAQQKEIKTQEFMLFHWCQGHSLWLKE